MIGNSNFYGFIFLLSYYIMAAGIISLFDYLTDYSREWIRKSYHIMYSFSLLIIIYIFSDWYIAVLVLLGISLAAVLILNLSVKLFPGLKQLSISRKSSIKEVLRQMIYLHSTFSLLILIFQYLGQQYIFHVVVGVMIWGFGDSAAALVGKFIGKREYNNIIFPSGKTLEGSLGFIGVSFFPAFIVLLFLGGYHVVQAMITAAVLVVLASLVEALSRKGIDTITIPLFAALFSVLLEKLYLYLI